MRRAFTAQGGVQEVLELVLDSIEKVPGSIFPPQETNSSLANLGAIAGGRHQLDCSINGTGHCNCGVALAQEAHDLIRAKIKKPPATLPARETILTSAPP